MPVVVFYHGDKPRAGAWFFTIKDLKVFALFKKEQSDEQHKKDAST
jgi:hypothetical protein